MASHESHPSTEHNLLGGPKHDIKAITLLQPKYISSRDYSSLDFLGLSQMGEKPIYAISSFEDDPLAEIARGCPEPNYPLGSALSSPCSPFTENEWQEIYSLSVSPRQLPQVGGKEDKEEEWNPVGVWFAANDLYEGLWEIGTDDDEEIQEEEEVWVKGPEELDDDNDDDDNYESLTRSVMDRLNLSVVGQWNHSSMENSIDSLKSAMRKLKNIASPEGSVVAGGDREGRWTSLLRL